MYRQKAIFVGLLLAGCLSIITGIGSAATINSTSCSQAAVQAAIEKAGIGDTVLVPPGQCTWSSAVSISDDKKIILQGAGIGSTVISAPSMAVNLNGSGSRITGFEFNLTSISSAIKTYGSDWRIDNCEFDYRPAGSKGNAVEADGRNHYYPTWSLSGLIDNCTFYDGRIVVTGSAVTGVSDPSKAYALMAQPADLGGSSAVYIEDCTFELNKFGNLIDANYGGAYVFRFNSVTKGNYTGYVVEAHSLQSTSRGTRKWEIYGNTFIGDGGPYAPFLLRGGIGIIFNNDLKGTWDSENIRIDNRRSTEDLGPGLCDGNTSWDGNIVGKSGLLCRDQIGTGPDSSIWTATPPYPSQPQMPMYSWGNDEVDKQTVIITRKLRVLMEQAVSGWEFLPAYLAPVRLAWDIGQQIRATGIKVGEEDRVYFTNAHQPTPGKNIIRLTNIPIR